MENFDVIQETIGYKFKNTDLLQQAFVRRSYSEEFGGQNNEVLEFIGDKALDLAVIRLMTERFGMITDEKDYSEFKLRNPKYFNTRRAEGTFTDIKKDLVQKKALAKAMNNLGFQSFLIMGKGDENKNIQNQDSVKEDLFEAIIGAVAIDSNWDMNEITSVAETMLDFDSYFSNEENGDENYVGKLQTWSQRKGYGLPRYSYNFLPLHNSYECRVLINMKNTLAINWGAGYGSSKTKARQDAAEKIFKRLFSSGYINYLNDAIGEFDYNDSIRILNELAQKGLVSKLKYSFEQDKYDSNGNPLWSCEGSVDDMLFHRSHSNHSKKEAQKEVAYNILCWLQQKERSV